MTKAKVPGSGTVEATTWTGASTVRSNAVTLPPERVMRSIAFQSMLFALAIGYVVFDEVPGLMVLLGAALIIGAGALIIWRERQLGLERARQRGAMTPQG